MVKFHIHYNVVGFFSYKVKGGPKCTILFVALDYDFVIILIYFNITFLDFFRENRVLKKGGPR